MNLTAFLLVLLIMAALGLLWALRRLQRGPDEVSFDRLELPAQPANEMYGPMARLFEKDDLDFLQEQAGHRAKLEKRFRKHRRQVLRLYLRQIRNDFRTLHEGCRLLARKGQNWELHSLAHRQLLTFYGLFFALQIRCLLGSFIYVQVDTRDLISAFHKLQQGVRNVANSLEPESRSALSANTR